MSLILEALRKSEAERRRGQSPDLYGATPLAASPRREGFRQWPVIAGGLLVLVAVALLFWPQSRQPTSETSAQVTVAAGTLDADIDTATAHAGEAHAPAPNAPTYPTPHDASAPMAADPALRPSQVPAAAPPPAPPTPRQSAAGPDAAAATPAAGPPETLPPAIAVPAPPEPALPPADILPSLATLSAGERAALPPLKLSVHVWNSDPTQRFAIVDGQRIIEGAALGNAVVAEIRRDGIVLDVNGRRVLLPRP